MSAADVSVRVTCPAHGDVTIPVRRIIAGARFPTGDELTIQRFAAFTYPCCHPGVSASVPLNLGELAGLLRAGALRPSEAGEMFADVVEVWLMSRTP